MTAHQNRSAFRRVLRWIGRPIAALIDMAANDPPHPHEICQSATAGNIRHVRARLGEIDTLFETAKPGSNAMQNGTRMALDLIPELDDGTDSGNESIEVLVTRVTDIVLDRRCVKSADILLGRLSQLPSEHGPMLDAARLQRLNTLTLPATA